MSIVTRGTTIATLFLAACGAETDRDATPVDCSSYVPQASPGAIAKSPRDDRSAEILALEASNAFVAPDALYARISAELAAIASAEPAVASITPLSRMMDSSVVVRFDNDGAARYLAGRYHAWDCANQAYGATEIADLSDVGRVVALTFGQKLYNTPKLVGEYAALPHVEVVEPSLFAGIDGPDICLRVNGELHLYLFDKADGDCESGCIQHLWYGFHVAPGPVVTKLGVFGPGAADSEPDWFEMWFDGVPCTGPIYP